MTTVTPIVTAAPSSTSGAAARRGVQVGGRASRRWETPREVALLGGLLGIYEGARVLGGHDAPAALRHAHDLLRVERWLHLPSEQHLQAALLHFGYLTRAANGFYASVHLPLTIVALVWLARYRREVYRRTRRALIAATALCLGLYLLLPVAPPRMMPGFVDTAARYGQSVYGSPGSHSLADQYAAFPSLHVGWAVLIAAAMITANRTRWRWLWLLHPIVTTVVVVSTGNHYWLDALAGAALTLTAFRLCRSRGSTSAAEPSGPAPATAGRAVVPTDLRRATLVDVPAVVALIETSPEWPRRPDIPPEVVPAAMRLALAHVGLDQGEVWVLATGDEPAMAAIALLPPLSDSGLDELLGALEIELGLCPTDDLRVRGTVPMRSGEPWAVLQGDRLPAGVQTDAAITALRSRALAAARDRVAQTA